MKQRTSALISTFIVFSMIAVPVALSSLNSTVIIQNNIVELEPSTTGGIDLPSDIPMETRPDDSDKFGGHPGFWIHSPSAGNDLLPGTQDKEVFQFSVPANSKFVIMVERPSVLTILTYLSFDMKFDGDSDWIYYADNKNTPGSVASTGVVYYSAASEAYLNGNRLIPQNKVDSLVFMEYDRDVIIEIDCKREQFTLRLAIIFA